MNKLKGCAQMVANMLRRDKLPVRDEAATELLEQVARIESEIVRLKNENARLTKANAAANTKIETQATKLESLQGVEKKRADLWNCLNKLEFYSDRVSICIHPGYDEVEDVLENSK